VITQVALSLVLLVISGLLLRSLSDKLHTDLGFDVKRILAVSIDLSRGRYDGRDPLTSFYDPLLEKAGQLPGVKAVGLIDTLPVAAWGDGYDIHITGQPPYPVNASSGAETRYVSRGYFDAMGLKIIEGRPLSPELDRFKEGVENQSSKMVVNDAFRRKFFPDGSHATGAHIDDDPKPEFKSEIVGVSTSIRQDMTSPPMPEMDWLIEGLDPAKRLDPLRSMYLLARTEGDPKALIPAVREAMRQVDSTVSMRAVPMEDVLSEQLTFDRLQSWLFGIFAAFALLLAVIGLYGLISHEVELRTREIGIRMALGSTRGVVMRQVMRRVALLLACGTAVGWLLSIALSRILASIITIRTSADFFLMAAMTVGLLLVGLMTSLGPARSAASIEPVRALRAD
jgi:predicted permease